MAGESYPPEVWDEIFERVATGATLTVALAQMADLGQDVPTMRGVMYALTHNDKLEAAYLRAREIQALAILDEAIGEMRDRERDMYRGDGGMRPNAAAVARSKLIVDTAFKNAEKLRPREYGNKAAIVTEDAEGKAQPIYGAIVPPKAIPKVGDDDADTED